MFLRSCVTEGPLQGAQSFHSIPFHSIPFHHNIMILSQGKRCFTPSQSLDLALSIYISFRHRAPARLCDLSSTYCLFADFLL